MTSPASNRSLAESPTTCGAPKFERSRALGEAQGNPPIACQVPRSLGDWPAHQNRERVREPRQLVARHGVELRPKMLGMFAHLLEDEATRHQRRKDVAQGPLPLECVSGWLAGIGRQSPQIASRKVGVGPR